MVRTYNQVEVVKCRYLRGVVVTYNQVEVVVREKNLGEVSVVVVPYNLVEVVEKCRHKGRVVVTYNLVEVVLVVTCKLVKVVVVMWK